MSATKLGSILKQDPIARYAPGALAAAQDARKTTLGNRLAEGRRGEDVAIPGLGPVRLELLGARASQEVEAAVYRNMLALGIDLGAMTLDRFELERAVVTLAEAAREPADRSLPFGTLAEWQRVDPVTIITAWDTYLDVKDRLDPLDTPLTDDERDQIERAIQKKDRTLLRSFGVAKLSLFMLSTVAQPSISPPPSSPNTDSGSDS